MPTRVYTIEINDDMAPAGKTLMNLHVGIVVLTAVMHILDLVKHLLQQDAYDDFERETGVAHQAETGDFGTAGAVIYLILSVSFTLLVFFWLFTNIKSNNQQSMQALCFVDGYCLCCAVLGLMSTIMAIMTNRMRDSYMNNDVECRATGYWDGSQLHTSSSYDQDRCQKSLDTLMEANAIAFPFDVIRCLLILLNVAMCGVITLKTSEATNQLRKGKMFVGMPNASMGNPAMVIGQVVGQPVSGPAHVQGGGTVVGNPVQGGAPPPQYQPGNAAPSCSENNACA